MSDEPEPTVAAPRPTDVSDPAALRKTLDDAVGDILFESQHGIGFTQSMAWANRKLVLMTLTVAAGCVAQFAPLPQPKMRWALGGFVLLFFFLNTVLQFITTYVDKEYIFLIKVGTMTCLCAACL